MEEVVASPVLLLPDFLVCLTAIRDANLKTPKIGWFHRSEISVKDIFTDNHNWDRYYYVHRQEVRPAEREAVKQMKRCKGPDRGGFVYYCPTCKRSTIVFPLGATTDYAQHAASGIPIDQWSKPLGAARQ